MADHITWTRGRYAVDLGTVNGVELFQASQSNARGDTSWDLRVELPGIKRHHKAADEQTAKATAEILLGKFLDRLGLEWKVETDG